MLRSSTRKAISRLISPSEPYESGPLGGAVVHEYAPPAPGTPLPWVFDAVIHDANSRLRGALRFALPYCETSPHDVRAVPASRFPLPLNSAP